MKEEKKLDHVLQGKRAPDASTAPLVAAASELKQLAPTTAPAPGNVRTMFVSGVHGRPGRGIAPFLAPVAAGTALVLALGFTAGNALPGERIYVVRKAMAAVGLVSSPAEQAVALLDTAEVRLAFAEELLERTPARARGLGFAAIAKIEGARRLLEDVSPQVRTQLEERIESLTERALVVITIAIGSEGRVQEGFEDELQEEGDEDLGNEGPGGDERDDGNEGENEADDDDNSGPGGDNDRGDDSGGDDSGEGSGD